MDPSFILADGETLKIGIGAIAVMIWIAAQVIGSLSKPKKKPSPINKRPSIEPADRGGLANQAGQPGRWSPISGASEQALNPTGQPWNRQQPAWRDRMPNDPPPQQQRTAPPPVGRVPSTTPGRSPQIAPQKQPQKRPQRRPASLPTATTSRTAPAAAVPGARSVLIEPVQSAIAGHTATSPQRRRDVRALLRSRDVRTALLVGEVLKPCAALSGEEGRA